MRTDSVNLLPWPERRNQLLRRRLRGWSVIWLLTVLVLVLLGWLRWNKLQTLQTELTHYEHEYAPLEELRQETEQVHRTIAELQEREQLTLRLSAEQSMLQLMGVLSQAVDRSHGEAGILRMHWNNNSDGQRVLQLDGVAVTNQDVARLATALRELGAFASVDLKSTSPTDRNGVSARSYSLECRL